MIPSKQALFATLAILEILVLGQALSSYLDGFFTLSQMQHRGIDFGLPFAWHFAMWSDLIVISPLASFLVGLYWHQWSLRLVLLSAAFGILTSLALHWLFSLSAVPEAHIIRHQITNAGALHFVYMAVVISIFSQFFLSTRDIPLKLLALVSALLVVHVFVGTHMALGIIKARVGLDWYPPQPLESASGWMLVGVMTAALLCRIWWALDKSGSFDSLPTLPQKSPTVRNLLGIFEFWTMHKFDTTEKYLKFLDYIASYVGYTAFFGVFLAKLQSSTALDGGIFNLGNWIAFITREFLPCFLIFLFGVIYQLGKQSIRLEMTYAVKLFPRGRVPDNWGSPRQRVVVLLQVILFLLLFLSLTWFSDNIKVASFIMLVLACGDLRTRHLINEGIRKYFSDAKFLPFQDDPERPIIEARRSEVRHFLFERPHLWKEFWRIVGCSISFTLAVYGYVTDDQSWSYIAYIVLISALVFNEYVSLKWRIAIWKKLTALDAQSAPKANQ